jgi:hypothetical protein
MSKKEDFIHHRKLEELSDLGTNPIRDDFIPNANENLQQEAINEPKEIIQNNENENENINENINEKNINIISNNNNNNNNSNTIEDLESIYDQLLRANERIQFLNQEVFNLKQVIDNKDSIIAEYESTLQDTTEKMIRLQDYNDVLKNKLNSIQQNNYGYEKDNINNNQYFIDSINDIKNNLGLIQDDYNQKIMEKEEIIHKLNYDLEQSHDIRIQINNILNSIYNQNEILNTKLSCLLKEKEILLNEKEKDHNEIIRLNEILINSENVKNINDFDNLKKNYEEKENKYIIMLKDQEQKYVEEISNLHRYIVEREKEIENLKEKYQDVITKINLDNERLRNKINYIENLPISNRDQLIID